MAKTSKKQRIDIPRDVAARVLFLSDRTCCVCRVRGRPVQIHHVDENPANFSEENLAVLCFDCHRDTQIRGGFDRKLDDYQVRLFREDWLDRVRRRRQNSEAHFEGQPPAPAGEASVTRDEIPYVSGDDSESGLVSLEESGLEELANLIRSLPERRRRVYQAAQPLWDSGVTQDMVQGSRVVLDELTDMLHKMAAFYPEGHFGPAGVEAYLEAEIRSRAEWHWKHSEVYGEGQGGTLSRVIVSSHLAEDVERMVSEMVNSLTWMRSGFNFQAWKREWEQAI